MNVIGAISTIRTVWGVKRSLLFSSGVFYWGKKPQQSKVYLFEYGVSILSLTYFGGVWEFETVLTPFAKHSHKITVEHPKVSDEFEISSVKIVTNKDGFIRTYINS